MKKMDVIKAIRYTLVTMIPLLVNQEAWFFGYKIEGIKASCWLLTNGIIGLVPAYSLLRSLRYSFLATSFFFLVNFINSMVIPLQGLAYSPFYSLGLILSLQVMLEVKK